MFAIIETGGKQYRVTPRSSVLIEKLEAEVGTTVEFDRVLMVHSDEGMLIGQPLVTGARVTARVSEQGRGRKVVIQKFKRRKKYRRQLGHRQPFTRVFVTDIVFPA